MQDATAGLTSLTWEGRSLMRLMLGVSRTHVGAVMIRYSILLCSIYKNKVHISNSGTQLGSNTLTNTKFSDTSFFPSIFYPFYTNFCINLNHIFVKDGCPYGTLKTNPYCCNTVGITCDDIECDTDGNCNTKP